MTDMYGIVFQAFMLIGSLALGAATFYYFRFPPIVGFIFTGILIGPNVTGLMNSVPGVELISDLGVIFLMFTIGLEMSWSRVQNMKRDLFGLGGSQVVGTCALVTLIFYYVVGYEFSKSVVFSFMMMTSCTAIVLKLIQDNREDNSPHGNAILGILLFQDLAVIPIMMLLPILESRQVVESFELMPVLMGFLKQGGIVLSLVVFSKWLLPRLFPLISNTHSKEIFFFFVVFVCLGTSLLVNLVGFPLSFGAFLAGFMLADSPFRFKAGSEILPFRDSFLGIFFAAIGMLLDPVFLITNLHWVALIVLSLFVFKSLLIFLTGVLVFRMTATTAWITGFCLFQIGEFSFIIANKAKASGLMNDDEFQMFLAVAVVSLILSPFVYNLSPRIARKVPRFWWDKHKHLPQDRIVTGIDSLTSKDMPPSKTIIIGCGIAGQTLLDVLSKIGGSCHIIEQNYETVRKLLASGYEATYGDAGREDVLIQAGIENAKICVVTASGFRTVHEIIQSAHNLRPDLPILVRTSYHRDIPAFSKYGQVDLVVAEHETAIEILARVLSIHGFDQDEILSYMRKSRSMFKGDINSFSDSFRRKFDLSSMQTLSLIQPFLVRKTFVCVGRTIAELNLRRDAQVNIASIFRDNLGMMIPSPDLILEIGDVLHLIGTEPNILKAREILSGLPDPSAFSVIEKSV